MIEDQCQPGTHGRVLKNLLGIKSKREISRVETIELLKTTKTLIENIDHDHRFTKGDIVHIHQMWMGSIYEWAGRYRQVTMSKGGFPFSSPLFIPELMKTFEQDILFKYTPCILRLKEEILYALAVVHVELLLIHPFREGNGRLARLLSTLMALQSDLPLLDFTSIKGGEKEKYFAAVRAGIDRNYEPMMLVFSDVISRTLVPYGKTWVQ
jgi:cell filamentation protein